MKITIKSGETELTHESGVLIELPFIKRLCAYVAWMEQKRKERRK